MKQFYFHNGAEQLGPYELTELKQQKLTRQAHIWHEGLSEWTAAENIEELKSFFSNTPPPFTLLKSTPPPPIFTPPLPAELYPFEEPKKSYAKPLIIIVSVLSLVVAGWLIFQNQEQKETIANVQQQITEQEIKSNEKEQAEQEKLENQKQKTEALIKKNSEFRNNWQNYIGVIHAQYKYSALGGIDAFDIHVKNNTDYLLNEVSVSVDYIKAAGGIYKTEIVAVSNIGPHSEGIGKAPNSPRGASISVDITSMYSRDMHFCYPNYDNPKAISYDPYYCK